MFAGMLALCDFEKKEVALTDNGVIISNFKVSILVPYDEIKEFRLGDSKATVGSIIVTFMSKTPFGNKIYFKPVVDLRETKRLLQLAGVRLEGGFNRV